MGILGMIYSFPRVLHFSYKVYSNTNRIFWENPIFKILFKELTLVGLF